MKRATEKQTMENVCKLMIETSEHCIARKIFIHIKKQTGLQHDAHKGIKEWETYDTNDIKSNNAILA